MRILKWIMKAALVLLSVTALIVFFADYLGHTYKRLTWVPPMEINGVATGMTRSDVVFKIGVPDSCSNNQEHCFWKISHHQVSFKDEIVNYQSLDKYVKPILVSDDKSKSSLTASDILAAIYKVEASTFLKSIPFEDTQGMKSLLGDEDKFEESEDYHTRWYTYSKWGASFKFVNDRLAGYSISDNN